MFYSSPSTNSPTAFRTTNNYSQTYSGPIAPDQNIARTPRVESMAKAAFSGNPRAFRLPPGPGIQAGSAMAGYRSAMQANAEASKQYAQAQQDDLNRLSALRAANLQFQERQAGEQGYLRDLLLDRDDALDRERMSAYKRWADKELNSYQIRVEDAVAARKREAMIWSSLL